MKEAVIFNIQKFCLHDGPGIRTTIFFKGCPLNCWWCHNPESQSFHREFFYNRENCSGCGRCLQSCPQGAILATPRGFLTDVSRCLFCGNCTAVCFNNAREMVGRPYTVHELVKEIETDRPFYEQSGGGVTLSGGEALCQIDFVVELVKILHQKGISVALDTCGHLPFSSFARVLEYVDVFLYDLKLMDEKLHKQYTGQDNQLILENLVRLVNKGAVVHLRIPLLDGINTDDDQIIALIDFVKDLKISRVHLLPYHATGSYKYTRLQRDYPGHLWCRPTNARLEEIKQLFEANKLNVKIGG